MLIRVERSSRSEIESRNPNSNINLYIYPSFSHEYRSILSIYFSAILQFRSYVGANLMRAQVSSSDNPK